MRQLCIVYFLVSICASLGREVLFNAASNAKIIAARIDEYCADHKFRRWGIDIDSAIVKKFHDIEYQCDFVWFDNPDYWMKFSPRDGELVQCVNWQMKRDLTEIDNKTFREFSAPRKPLWSAEFAKSVAADFVKICLADSKGGLGPPHAEFVQEYGSYDEAAKRPRYKMPFWDIKFPRIDSKGRAFNGEYVNVKMYEEVGPFYFEKKTPSIYEQSEGREISRQDALTAAFAYAKRLQESAPLSGTFKNGSLKPTPVSAELEIVRPNHLAELNDLPRLADIDIQAKLAWVFWFEWNSTDLPRKQKVGAISSWVDAYSGHPLGGDAFFK